MAELTILKDVNKIPHPNVIKFIGGCTLAGIQMDLECQIFFDINVASAFFMPSMHR